MIKTIEIADVATYGSDPEVLRDLSKFNFFFGSNGSGKTTITRVIADEADFPTCSVTWEGSRKLHAMVYNRDFIERNFSAELKGIFTLGKENIDNRNRITSAKGELDELNERIAGLKKTLEGDGQGDGMTATLESLEEEFKLKCWAQKQKHDAKLSDAFTGYRDSVQKFKEKLLREHQFNIGSLETLADLEERAATVFGEAPTSEQSIPVLEATEVISHESNEILQKRVIGKKDVDIAAMIQKLGNSDWVREGRDFYEANQEVCPFCQQKPPATFTKSLDDYFDEAFENDSKAIDDLVISYQQDSTSIQQRVGLICEMSSAIPEVKESAEKIKAHKELLDTAITVNLQRLAEKKKEPSRGIALKPIKPIVTDIETLIETANALIDTHNKRVANLNQERSDLTSQVWKYLLDVELKDDLEDYEERKKNLRKGIDAISTKIAEMRNDIAKKTGEIRTLEKQTTSIQPTIDDVNNLLSSFGFKGFSLAKADNDICYKLVRPDGTDAQETLSEGETSFVTFLYFYHLLKGSHSEAGMTTDRVVVFDDPVSSLDSDILFIVGSLIKALFGDIQAGTSHIKQVFVLTHNVYFHKEITFSARRGDRTVGQKTFWVVRKSGLESKVEKHDTNPIKTSYQLLWNEVFSPGRSNLTIQNTIRRILENYFKILGDVDPDAICAKFDGNEKLICKSLFSWVNDGSHYADDDLYVSTDQSATEIYLTVFKAIFEKSDHLAHYEMMENACSSRDAS